MRRIAWTLAALTGPVATAMAATAVLTTATFPSSAYADDLTGGAANPFAEFEAAYAGKTATFRPATAEPAAGPVDVTEGDFPSTAGTANTGEIQLTGGVVPAGGIETATYETAGVASTGAIQQVGWDTEAVKPPVGFGVAGAESKPLPGRLTIGTRRIDPSLLKPKAKTPATFLGAPQGEPAKPIADAKPLTDTNPTGLMTAGSTQSKVSLTISQPAPAAKPEVAAKTEAAEPSVASTIPTTAPAAGDSPIMQTSAIANPFAATAGDAKPVAKPVASAGDASLHLSWKSVGSIDLGQPCRCVLEVTNTGKGTATGVSLETDFPKTVRLTGTTPQPDVTQSFLGWNLGEIAPGATRQIAISFVPSSVDAVKPTARVRYTSNTQASFAVLQPALAAKLVAATEPVRVGEPATQTVILTNPGTGIARNVQVEVAVPSGLSHPAGKRLITDVGPLHPAETRSVRINLTAVEGGDHEVVVRATADSSLLSEASSIVSVASPKLATAIDGPKLRYLGRTADFMLKVTNEGRSADENVRLMHKIPAGYEFVSASRGSRFDASTNIVSWFVGQIEAGSSKTVAVTLKAAAPGSHTHFVRATGGQGSHNDASLTSRVEAVASLNVEVSDLDDPVEVGREVAYEIKVTNEGSAAAEEVRLNCDLPRGATITSSDAAVPYRMVAGVLQFDPIAAIAPGQTVTIQVKLKATGAGRSLFRARVASGTGEPITSEESTRFYGE